MYWIIIIVLAVLFVVAYLLGAKQQQGWGKVVMVLCLIGFILLGLDRAFFHVIGGRTGEVGSSYADSELGQKELQTKMIVDPIRGQLPQGCRVFALRQFHPQGSGVVMGDRVAVRNALRRILGEGEYELVAEWGPMEYGRSASAQEISQAIAGSQIDLFISYAGLPQDLPELSIYDTVDRPLVGAYFPQEVDTLLLREWLQDGLVDVAVVRQEGELRRYTPDRLP
jgi:hypothetical protein